MKEYPVTVTAEDIANGKRLKPAKCPLALACTRQLPGGSAIVGPDHVEMTPFWLIFGLYKTFTAPGMKEFTRKFDTGQKVEPQTFIFTRQ